MVERTTSALRRAAAPLLVALPWMGPWLAFAASAAAQDYAVVQAVPPPAAAELSVALRRLARSPSDFDALIAAGRASLAMGDIDAALGFFGRADGVRPGDARVKAGLAVANLKQDRPIEALALFDQAQAAGAPPATLAADRGLAFDLVGDNASAQVNYRMALAQGADPEISRRLGLSQAISGDRKAFEATLLPLLQRRDFAAYRVRAFGLAILGEEQEAVSIAEAVMPRDLASRITPYLRYMPRLTRAQQAAAANLGSFPRAAQIGRDDPRFAQYAGPSSASPTPRGADARLAPAGRPLGPAAKPASKTDRRPTAADRKRERDEAKRRADLIERQRQAALTAARAKPPVTIARADPPPSPPVQVMTQASPPASPPPPPPSAPLIQLPTPTPTPTLTPTPTPAPIVVAQQAPVTIVLDAPAAPPPEPATLADAFAEFTAAEGARAPAEGAVDITSIKPKRDEVEAPQTVKPKAPPPPPPPPKPKAPSRVWVQVATGKDVKALAFDWRKFGKQAPQLLGKRSAYTAKWGETRRLLTGPFDSPKAATKFVNDLKAAGIGAFTFTSAEGEDVAALK